jgi:hypothetical protein
MNIRYPLVAAAVAAGGLAIAQPVQVQFQKARLVEPLPAYPTPADTKTPPSSEFKAPANADPDPKSLAVPEETLKRAKELVGKLGSPQFSEREQATRDLAKMGRMALPALQEALGANLEPEVAMRAEGLLPKAESEDMKARVACFLADAGGKFQHTLPGWEKFKTVAGNDAASRKLFAEMLKSNLTHQMLLAAEKSVEEANAVLNQYVTRLWNQQNFGGRGGGWGGDFGGGAPAQPAKLPDMVAALFLESQFSDTEMTVQASIPWGWGGQGAQSVVNYVYNVPEVSNAIYSNNGEYAAPIRKILIQWMETRETAQWAYSAYNFANNIYQSDRKKTFKYALKVLESKGGQSGSYNKLNILQNFANQPNARDLLPALGKCLDDSLIIWNWQNQNPPFDIQFRDFALAYAIQLTDQKPEDFGMSRNGGGTGKQFTGQQTWYFKDDNPPQNGPNGGRIVRPVKPVNPPVEEPKKEDPKDPKKEDPKDKKLSQEDRRKAAVSKWNEWVKENVGVDDKDTDSEAKKKWDAWIATPPKKDDKKDGGKPADPKTEEPKKEEPKKEPLTAEQKKAAEKKEDAPKKEPDVAPAVLPKK